MQSEWMEDTREIAAVVFSAEENRYIIDAQTTAERFERPGPYSNLPWLRVYTTISHRGYQLGYRRVIEAPLDHVALIEYKSA